MRVKVREKEQTLTMPSMLKPCEATEAAGRASNEAAAFDGGSGGALGEGAGAALPASWRTVRLSPALIPSDATVADASEG